MIRKIRKWLEQSRETREEPPMPDPVQLAVAVLLVEIARADHEHKEVEVSEMLEQLAWKFDLSPEEASDLLNEAQEQAENSVSLHEFTSAVHSDMSYAEKEAVIEMLWRIALADQDLDKYEDYMIGKIAELLYVYRGDVLRLKERVKQKKMG